MFHRIVVICASLGLFAASSASAATVFPTNSAWKLFRGTAEASTPDATAWRAISFNDSGWEGPLSAPFHYGEPALTGRGTMLTGMQNVYSCIFLRRTFVISNVVDVAAIQLGSYCDDGFVAWINGHRVQTYNFTVPGEPARTNFAVNANEPVPFVLHTFTDPPASYLVPGTNVIAVQAFNTSLGSTDLIFDLSLTTFDQDPIPPTILMKIPAPGDVTNLTQVTVRFSEPVQNVDAEDFFINGVALSTVSGSGSNYTFTFPQPPYGTVHIAWGPQHNITDFGFPPNAFDEAAPGASWQYNFIDIVRPVASEIYPPPTVIVRTLGQIEITFSEDVNGVDAADLLINNQPATNVFRQPGGAYIFNFPQPLPGSVQVAWAAGHGITDFATTPNTFAGGSWSYVLDPNASGGDLVINEFMAANQRGITDENGEHEDWIEIYNRGSNTVNLAGWSLSDDPDLPGLWTLPFRSLGPGQYLVIFASAKNRKSLAGTNHTNFRLGIDGEHLGLYSPDSPRILVSGFTPFPEQRNDHSYGRDSSGNLRYFATPTPGGPNGNSSIIDVADSVHFSASRGHYSSPFDLLLSTPTPGAEIRYTRNGAEPTATTGFVYTGPVRITNLTIIRAAAFRPNFLPSKTVTHTYLYNLPANIRSLPIFSITTASNNWVGPTGILGMNSSQATDFDLYAPRGPADYHNPSQHGQLWEKPVSAEYIKQDNSGFQVDCGIRVQGSDYRRPRTYINQNFLNAGLKSATPNKDSKFSFRLYFRGDYGPGRLEYPLFTNTHIQSFNQLVLRGGMNDQDNPFIRDEWTRRVANDVGQVTPHGNHAIVLINGLYYTNSPFYNPTERIHEEMLQSYHGGSNEWDVLSPSFASSSEGFGVVDGDRNIYNTLVAYYSANNPATPSVYNELARRVDLVNLVDYVLVNVYVVMGDWPQNNFRMARDRGVGGVWRCYTWDAEWAANYDANRTVFYDIFAAGGGGPGDSGLSTSCEIANLYRRLTNSFEFRLLWADRTHKHMFNGGALTDQNLTNHFYGLRNELIQVLPNMSLTIAQNWVPSRRTNMFNQLNRYGLLASSNAPSFSQFGGRVARGFALTLSNPLGGTIYFTTNGNDPRVMFTGAVNPDAIAYSGPVTLNDTVNFKARSLSGTNWSALTEALFEVASLGIPLRITEIMYNPAGGAIYEFIEVQNVGPTPLNIGGMKVADAVSFTFFDPTILGPGETIVLANATDPQQFATRYPGLTVAGYFDGNLNNGGERITLEDRTGEVIVSVDYDNRGSWPSPADGGGYSLEIIDPRGDPDSPANWRASQQLNGTPGFPPSTPPPGAVRLNEILAENAGAVSNQGTTPDYIELFNSSGGSVDLSGWSLSDDGNPGEFILPPGTQISAGGYMLLWCDSVTNTTPGLHTGLKLDPAGVSISLFDAASNRVDIVTYGAQLRNQSIGILNTRWSLNTPTPATPNVAAFLAAATNLTLNEWMADPLPGQADWVELYNRGSAPISLEGFYLSVNNSIFQINSLSFVGPLGYIQLFANEQAGTEQLDFRLPAAGATVTLYDAAANQIDRITYGLQMEGISQGRLPDGAAAISSFASSVSPGASNYVLTYTGPYLNEVLARNYSSATNSAGQVSDFVELFNPTASPVNLAGMSLSLDALEPRQWIFPPNTTIPASGYLVLWCNSAIPPSTTSASPLNTGSSLDGESGSVYLFNVAGQIVSSVQYGPQVDNQSIGRIGSVWRLLAQPTAGAVNSSAAVLAAVTGLRINEWMARPLSGPDWVEIYNPAAQPADLNLIFITDDISSLGTTKFRPAPLSFIGASGFTRFIADDDAPQGRHHVNFNLDGQGESVRLYTTGAATIDTIHFGSQQAGVSQGRLPDGGLDILSFAGSASPGESNYLLAPGVRINEVLAHAALGDKAVELLNSSSAAADVGGWFLSNSRGNYQKYQITDGTSIPAGGFLVINESQFNNGSANAFSLDGSRGGELILSAVDSGGNLSGQRSIIRFGASLSNVSAGPIVTSVGTDVAALNTRTIGAANSLPKVGPIILSEIMYNPMDWLNPVPDVDGEYVELHNTGGQAIDLSGWRLGDAVEFTFPSGSVLDAGERLLVVNFDPAVNVAALTEFRQQYALGAGVTYFGPYRGKLSNGGDNLELYRPGTPEPGGFVPQILVDRANYSDSSPWPAGAVDGGGLSLQRRGLSSYGNEPLNWVAAAPTPSAPNSLGIVQAPSITAQPQDSTAVADTTAIFNVTASGGSPLAYQWRHNKEPIDDATNATLAVQYVQLEHEGDYDVIVSNPAGSAISRGARLAVSVPPLIFGPPQNVVIRPGGTASFSAGVRGSLPLSYRWFRDGVEIPSAISSTLNVPNVQPDAVNVPAEYTIVVSNRFGEVSASASLVVLVNPVFAQQPRSQFVDVGDTIRLTAVISNTTTLPMTYRWRKNVFFNPVTTNSYTNTFEIPDVVLTNGGLYSVLLTNLATNQMLSQFAYVTVVDPPVDQLVPVGGDTTLRAAVNGTGTLRYQWLFNGAPIIGATATNLVLTNMQPSQAGVYTLLMTNVNGNVNTSYDAIVTLDEPDTDGDGMPDTWEQNNGLLFQVADAHEDADNDGMKNGDEYRAGTDPQDDESYLKVTQLTVGGVVTIEFPAVAGKTYTVQYNDDLGSGAWAKLLNISARPTNYVEVVTDPAPPAQRFYRLITPRE
jgi:hypothetical protein